MAVYEVGHHSADLAAAISSAEAVREFVTHLSRRLQIHSVDHAEKEVEQNVKPFGGRQFSNAGQSILEKLFAIGVEAHA
jgi:hypothetical protein